MSKFSPGPWRWQDDSERVLLDAEGIMVIVQGDLTQADDADARLIAAAPEMYAWIKEITAHHASLHDDAECAAFGGCWLHRGLALLKRIEGEL